MGHAKSKLRSETVKNLQEVTYFSSEEIRSWYKAFIKEVPSGQMNADQFLKVWKNIFVATQQKLIFDEEELKNYGKQVFRVIDRNGDGTIDFREFLMDASIEIRGSLEQKLEHIFALYDLDQDGYITLEELREFIKLMNKSVDIQANTAPDGKPMDTDRLSDLLANKIFHRLDRNKDGRVNLFEFIYGVKSEPCLVEYFVGKKLEDLNNAPCMKYEAVRKSV